MPHIHKLFYSKPLSFLLGLLENAGSWSRKLPGVGGLGYVQFLQGFAWLFSLGPPPSGSSSTGLLVKFCLVNGDRQLVAALCNSSTPSLHGWRV